MYDEKFTVEMFNKGLTDLGILLGDENGLLMDILKTKYNERLERILRNNGIVEAFECMVDEVDRAYTILNWHDELCSFVDCNVQFCITGKVSDLDLNQFDDDDLEKLYNLIGFERLRRYGDDGDEREEV